MYDFHGPKTITLDSVANIAYSWLAVKEMINFFSLNVLPESFPKTQLKTRQIQGREHGEILGSKHSLI